MIKKLLFFLLVSLSFPLFGAIDDAYTVSLLHFNTGFTDESGKTWQALGNSAISNSEKKFGSGSLFLDGVGSYSYIICAASLTDFDFGSGPFTVDWWEYSTKNQLQISIARNAVASFPSWIFGFIDNHNSWCAMSSNASNWDILETYPGTLNNNIWIHRAVVGDGANPPNFYFFVNGNLANSIEGIGSFPADSNPVSIGFSRAWSTAYNSFVTEGFEGYLDEVRFSKGIARWTSNFTPPSTQYGIETEPPPDPAPPGAKINFSFGGKVNFSPGGKLTIGIKP